MDGVASDTFDYWWDNLDCLIVPMSSLAFFAPHIRSRAAFVLIPRVSEASLSASKEPKWTAQSLFALAWALHFEQMLNTISNIFSCDMVHLVSQQLILEEGMDLTGHRCLQTHSHMLTNEVLTLHNPNAHFRGILSYLFYYHLLSLS